MKEYSISRAHGFIDKYSYFQERTLKRIIELSGNVWTDYNAHDPGITIADVYNYALFDLYYRLDFPIENYLSQNPQVDYAKLGFISKEQLKEQSIVTEVDYANLFSSHCEELVEECYVIYNQTTLSFDVYVVLKHYLAEQEIEIKNRCKDLILATYHAHRNLGENIGNIEFRFKNQLDDLKPYIIKQKSFDKDYIFSTVELEEVKERVDKFIGFSKSYKTLQYDFPDLYNVSERGIPSNITGYEKSYLLNFKRFLLLMDTFIAGALWQVEHIAHLFDKTKFKPFKGYPVVDFVDKEEVIYLEREREASIFNDESFYQQKNILLDQLDVLLGEQFSAIFDAQNLDFSNNFSPSEIIEKRILLIDKFPGLNAKRNRSFNIDNEDSVPAIQQIMEYMTNGYFEQDNITVLNKYGLKLLSDEDFFAKNSVVTTFDFITNFDKISESEFQQVELLDLEHEELDIQPLRENIHFLRLNELFKSYLEDADSPVDYKVLALPENEKLLLYKYTKSVKPMWINMGIFKNLESLTLNVNRLWRFMRKMKQRKNEYSFYFIEHKLIREEEIEQSNHLSVITSMEGLVESDRSKIKALLSERLPAHLFTKVFFVPREKMNTLTHFYFDWRAAMAKVNPILENKVDLYKKNLSDFLHSNEDYSEIIE